MEKSLLLRLSKLTVVTGYYLLVAFPLVVSAAVTLQWDANNNPAPESYNLYQRQAGQTYNYAAPVNSEAISGTTYFIDNLQPGITYFFVVRAFSGETVSGDSNEAQYTEPAAVSDRDGDGIADSVDAFPDDADESVDTDNDGVGNNADTDDDNDGMPDSYEIQTDGLDPLVDDADDDLDGDNVSNKDEYDNGTNPSIETNYLPERPQLSEPAHQATVPLTPELTTLFFYDANGDSHAQTRYQIALDSDFTVLVLDRLSAEYLTELPIEELILDPETTYYWRVRFVDDQSGASLWSVPLSFTTVDYIGASDEDANGILDSQEVLAMSIDLDDNQEPDATQSSLMCVATADAINPHIAITAGNADAEVVGLRALGSDDISRAFDINSPDIFTGLISFKVYLDEGVTTASIIVYLTSEAPEDAAYYYHTEDGWVPYANATFSSDRRSVTLTLEDGGEGDQDGVENGVIIDPAGLGYSAQTLNSGNFGTTESTSCFVATPMADMTINTPSGRAGMLWGLILCGGLVLVRRQRA